MHIQPGILNGITIAYANEAALATVAAFVPAVLKRPDLIVRTILAALFFSVLMQIFHLPVGASELHLAGASTAYFLFGFIPTLLGFTLGLLLQGTLFEHQDLIHLGVNSLSLTLPLIATHAVIGRRFLAQRGEKTSVNWGEVVKFDGMYYSGVVAMVGFWLLNGNAVTPLAEWGTFAISYLPLVLLEPVLTVTLIKLIKEAPKASRIRQWTIVDALQMGV
jgi:cobalt/nickel transport system permease protein